MNSLEYEVDSMGGLMPQILALTAPPGARDNNRPPFQQQQQLTNNASSSQLATNGNSQAKAGEAGLAAHPYFRRPGRGHNHDCCDACSEGGDLICCDLCPASFHLTCHDPPLDEEEIPTGEWACHQCRMGGTEEEKAPNGKLNKVGKPSKRKEKEEKPKEETERKVFAGGRQMEISNTPLSTLIKAAAVINPTQFTLPYELTLPANFPGEPKETLIRKNGTRRGLPKKKPYELDNGIVPLPAKLCFQCNKSCRVGPLIPCDFCPLFYHLDCLDPPLATPPMGRWMCPNHPEHHVDTSLLTSHSLTERVKLWDKFTVPVDQDAVKLNFLQRCHRLNPPFRYKLKKVLRSRLRVPGSIKAHYQDPPDLLPHLSPSQYLPFPPPYEQHPALPPTTYPAPISTISSTNCTSLPSAPSRQPREESALKEDQEMEVEEGKERGEKEGKKERGEKEGKKERGEKEPEAAGELGVNSSLKATPEERDQWLASLLYLQSSTLRHLAKSDSLPHKPHHGDKEPCNGIPQSSPPPLETRPNFLNGDLVSHDTKPHKIDGLSNHISRSGAFSYPQTSLFFSGSKKGGHKAQKNKLSSSAKSSKQKKNTPTEILADTLSNLEVALREKIEENNAEINVSSLEQSVVEVLAHQRLKQIMEPSKPTVEFSCPPLAARALLCPLVPDIRLKDLAPKHKYSSDPIPMTYRILNIGKGSQNHVNLELYGHCNYISHHHACILFDETTGHYELLNYSEFSTKVDGVTYHCDFTDRTVSQAVPPPFLQQVKAIIAKRRGVQSLRVASPPPAMTNRPGESFVRCECKRKEGNASKPFKESGWEGTAVLHHGSYIRFGCLKFVFSVVEEASKGDWSRDTLVTYEKFLKEADSEREKEKPEETKEEEDKKEDKSTAKS